MRRIHEDVVRKGEQFRVQAVVEQTCQLRWCMFRRKIGAPHVSDEERVAGQDRPGCNRSLLVSDDQADAFAGVARCLKDSNDGFTELQFEAVAYRNMGKRGTRLGSDVDFCSSASGEFAMP